MKGVEDSFEENCPKIFYAPLSKQDHGWAWVILFSSFIMQMLLDGTIGGFGILIKPMLNDKSFLKANYTTNQLNLPGAIQPCLCIMSVGITGPLVKRLGFQWVVIGAGILSGASLAIASFLKEIVSFTIFYGVLTGLGFGSIYLCAILSVTSYFDKYRGLACGISGAGNGVGYIVVPLILSKIMEHLNWRHALLIFSIVSLFCFMFTGLTMRPIMVLPIGDNEFSLSKDKNTRLSLSSIRPLRPLPTLKEEVSKEAMYIQNNTDFNKAKIAGFTTNKLKTQFTFSSMPALTTQSNEINNHENISLHSKSDLQCQDQAYESKRLQWKSFQRKISKRLSIFQSKRGSVENTKAITNHLNLLSMPHFHKVRISKKFSNNYSFISGYPGEACQHSLTLSHLLGYQNTNIRLSNGICIGKPIALNPLARADSFYNSSLSSLRLHDKQICEALRIANEKNASSTFTINVSRGYSNLTLPSVTDNELDILRSILILTDEKEKNKKVVSSVDKIPVRLIILDYLKEVVNPYLFKKMDFIVILIITCSYQLAYFIPFVYIVSYATEFGITDGNVLIIFTILGIFNCFGRCFGGLLADIRWVNTCIVSAFGCILTACCHFALTAVTPSFSAIAVYAGFYGFFCSLPSTVLPVLTVEFIGINQLSVAIGNLCFFRGIAAVVGPILAGVIVNASQNTLYAFVYCGVCFALSGFMHLGFYHHKLRKRH